MTVSKPDTGTREAVARSRVKFLLLVALAFLPVMAAYGIFFHFPEYMPSATTNQGELVQPPIRGELLVARFERRETWSLLQLAGTPGCDERCETMLYLSRQVVSGLGKDTERVSRYLITPGEVSARFRALLSAQHGDVEIVRAGISRLKAIPGEKPALFLMDPQGNIMMRYSLELAGKPLLKDLKHLLRISNIG